MALELHDTDNLPQGGEQLKARGYDYQNG